MPRRTRTLATLGGVCVLLAGARPPSARAGESPLVTTGTGAVLVSRPEGLGGAGTLALSTPVATWGSAGRLRLGGVFGGAAITSDDDQVVRVFGLVGPHAALALDVGGSELALRVAAGLWAGGLDERLRAGGLASGGLWWTWRLGDEVRLGAGVDVLFLFGPGDELVVYAPGVTVAWTLPSPEDAW